MVSSHIISISLWITNLLLFIVSDQEQSRKKSLAKSSQIVVEPRDGFLVTEGAPGVLQFYNPVTDRFVNGVSRYYSYSPTNCYGCR